MNCLTDAWALQEPELRGWARHRLGNAEDTEDLLQDLFLKALRQGERFCSVHNARAWLFEVARNTLADRLRVARDTVELPDDLANLVEEADTVDSLTACLEPVRNFVCEAYHPFKGNTCPAPQASPRLAANRLSLKFRPSFSKS